MNKEVILALALAGILSVGGVWTIAATADTSAAGTLGANSLPALTTLAGPALEGTTNVGETTSEVLTMNATGVVNVTFTLRWSGTNALQLAVAPSNATGLTAGAESEAESDGEIVLTLAVPNEAADGTLGVGDWEASVSFVEASSGTPVPVPAGVPGSPDTSVSWTLETSLQAHASA